MKGLLYRLPCGRSFAKLLSILAFVALGFIFYSSDAYAAIVLHGIDGGSTSGDGKFIWDGKCVNTVTKGTPSSATCGTNNSLAPTIGYLYKGPDSSNKFSRTGTCWSRSLGKSVACSTATGFISTSFSHHGILIEGGAGDFSLVLGEISPAEQQMTVVPGALGVPIKVTIDTPSISVTGYDLLNNNQPLGTGNFHYHVEFSIPLATLDPDDDRGGGNQKKATTCATKCDPQNPKFGQFCTGCVANQTCSNLSGTEFPEFQFTVTGFCQQGVTVEGYLTWLDPNPSVSGDTPPEFTNCPDDASNCTLRVGGLPGVKGTIAGLPGIPGTVDPDACLKFFPALALDSQKQFDDKQILLFQQNYFGQCLNVGVEMFGLEDPNAAKAGIHRVCNSDYGPLSPNQGVLRLDGEGFDDVQRGCVMATDANGNTVFHTLTGEEQAKSTEVTVEVKPETVNLKWKTDPSTGKVTDNGVATAYICSTPEFPDVNVVDITVAPPVLFVDGDTNCDGKPCTVPAVAGGFTIAPSAVCGSDSDNDLAITYRTATDAGDGLSQVIKNAKPGIQQQDPVTLKLQGQRVPVQGKPPVILYGTDTVSVTGVE
jgi:hypothetical protein